MDAPVWISLAGIASTAAASVIAFHFGQKTQRLPLRQELYKKQIELLSEFVHIGSHLHLLAELLSAADLNESEAADATETWQSLAAQLFEVTQRSGVVMPAAAYSAMTLFRAATHNFEDAIRSNRELLAAHDALTGSLGRVFMVAREVVGADTLGAESIRLHSAEGYERMNAHARHHFARIFASLWRKHQRETRQ